MYQVLIYRRYKTKQDLYFSALLSFDNETPILLQKPNLPPQMQTPDLQKK